MRSTPEGQTSGRHSSCADAIGVVLTTATLGEVLAENRINRRAGGRGVSASASPVLGGGVAIRASDSES
jgi:hypothetical protein